MPQVLPVQNLAPAKPLFDAAEKDNAIPTYIESGLTELLTDLMKRDEQTFREIIDTTEITSNFCQGKQIFQQTTNGWRIQNLRRTNPNKITAINNMQYYLTQNIENFISSNPDIEASEEFKVIENKEKIKKASAIWNGYERQWYKPWFNQQQALHCILSGTYIESVQYDQLAAGAKAFKEIWGEVEVPVSEGQGKCFACDFKGNAEDMMPEEGMPQCPECGSYDIHVSPAISQMMPSVTGLQPIQMGDLKLKLIPIQSCRFDVKKRAEESSYFIERIAVYKSKLDFILGTKLRLGDADKDRGLKSLDTIQRAGNTLYGQDNAVHAPDTKDAVLSRVSLFPEEYAHIKCNEYETVDGQQVPKGAKLIDLAPNGCTVLYANDKIVLGIYRDILHTDEVSSGVYHMRLESGIGRGFEDNVEVQKRFTRNDNQMLKAGETGATPAHFHVEGSVDRRHVKQIGFPGVSIPIKREVVEALGTTELIRQIPPSSVAGTFFSYTYDLLARFGQMTAHAPDLSNSLFNQNSGGTATEARISDSNAERLSNPLLSIKADVRLGTAHNTMRAYPKHFKGVSKAFSYGTTNVGTAVVDQIKGEDIDPTIVFVVVKDSQRPKTRYSQQASFAAVMQMTGGAAGLVALKQADPELTSELLKTFDLDLSIDDYDTDEDLNFLRVQQAVALAKQGITAPDIILANIHPPIDIFELDHKDKAVWMQHFLSAPPGRDYALPERQAVGVLIVQHYSMSLNQEALLAQAAGMVQQAAAQPAQQDQIAREDALRQEDRANSEQDAARQEQASAQDQAAQAQSEDINHQRQLQTDDLAHQRALEMESLKAQQIQRKA